MRKFSEVLSEYLEEYDHQNSDYYDSGYIGNRMLGVKRLQELANEMDKMIHGVEE